jgi:SHAQKYF class myb-like DNA-binding protein
MKRHLNKNSQDDSAPNLTQHPSGSDYSENSFDLEFPRIKSEVHKFSSEKIYGGGISEGMVKDGKKRKIKSKQTVRESRHVRQGRWSTEEHDTLMKALDIYGNNWSELEKCVKTRSSHQIRSHLQKHFLKQRKMKIMELSKVGLLHSKLFVVTREYRNIVTARKKFGSKLNQYPVPVLSLDSQEELDEHIKLKDSSLSLLKENDNDDVEAENVLSDSKEDEELRLNFELSSFAEQGEFEEDFERDFGLSGIREETNECYEWKEF